MLKPYKKRVLAPEDPFSGAPESDIILIRDFLNGGGGGVCPSSQVLTPVFGAMFLRNFKRQQFELMEY